MRAPARLLAIAVVVVAFSGSEHSLCWARPHNLQEGSESGFAVNYLHGVWVGLQTVLGLMGLYSHDTYGEWGASVLLGLDGPRDQAKIDLEEIRAVKAPPGYVPTRMQVVGLGLGRTGSTSLSMALEILGYTPIHDDEHLEEIDVFEAIDEEAITEDVALEILGRRGYNATFKTSVEWASRHPEAKAILTVRDTPEKYVDSWLKVAPFVDDIGYRPYRWFAVAQDLEASMQEEYKLGDVTGNQPESYLDQAVLRQAYINYIKKVDSMLASGQLLVFNVKQGWGPLCKHLGVSVPSGVAFPHVHNTAKVMGEMHVVRVVTWIWPLFIVPPALCVWTVCLRGRRWRRSR